MGQCDESKVYSATYVDDNQKLIELTSRMRQQSQEVKLGLGYETHNAVKIIDNALKLADTVLEFLKVAGWSRS